ncbi:MAG: hypothetical protein L0226_01395 [Acidobacteria bacterium]|nr:hypothetical protein [Acidobacteriota bacterium]
MDGSWQRITGVVVRGHEVASRKSEHYPLGTIEMQIPYFKERGLDLSSFYRGTINVSIAPLTITLINPEYTFRSVKWTTAHPAEDFSFSRCQVVYKEQTYSGWIYYPHPETKERHFHNPSIIELIAPLIRGMKYEERVDIEINRNEISVCFRETEERKRNKRK